MKEELEELFKGFYPNNHALILSTKDGWEIELENMDISLEQLMEVQALTGSEDITVSFHCDYDGCGVLEITVKNYD